MILRTAHPWLVGALVVSSCAAPGPGPPFDLTTAVVSDDTTGQIFVSAPDADGPWPVVIMLHGIGGDPHELDRLAATVAEQGNVVFNIAWDPAGDLTDVVCGYRYTESIAARYGGNPEHVAAVGYSAGAVVSLLGANSTEPQVPVSDMQLCSLVDGRVSSVRTRGNHLTLVYHDMVDSQLDIVPNSPAGQRVTQTIIDTIASADWSHRYRGARLLAMTCRAASDPASDGSGEDTSRLDMLRDQCDQ